MQSVRVPCLISIALFMFDALAFRNELSDRSNFKVEAAPLRSRMASWVWRIGSDGNRSV